MKRHDHALGGAKADGSCCDSSRIAKTVSAHDHTHHDHDHHAKEPTHACCSVPAGEPSARAIPPTGTIYTCPMHPEVRQAGPGVCPKCGMALEPEMPSSEETENPELRDFQRRFWWTLPLTMIVTVAILEFNVPSFAR